MSMARVRAGVLGVAVQLFAASWSATGRAAESPGAEACTAIGAGKIPALATLTAAYETASAAQPAHCVVRGSAAPRTGVDGKTYETRFELRLPTAWWRLRSAATRGPFPRTDYSAALPW